MSKPNLTTHHDVLSSLDVSGQPWALQWPAEYVIDHDKQKKRFIIATFQCSVEMGNLLKTFFINCSKTKCGTRTAYFCLSSSWHFFCVEQLTISKKCWAVKIQEDDFQAVDPLSAVFFNLFLFAEPFLYTKMLAEPLDKREKCWGNPLGKKTLQFKCAE